MSPRDLGTTGHHDDDDDTPASMPEWLKPYWKALKPGTRKFVRKAELAPGQTEGGYVDACAAMLFEAEGWDGDRAAELALHTPHGLGCLKDANGLSISATRILTRWAQHTEAVAKKAEPARSSGEDEHIAWNHDAWDPAAIPRCPWIAPAYFLRRAITLVIGPAGVSKSSLMIAYGGAFAIGEPLHKMKPLAQCRVMIYNVEDDADEQRRRLSGALEYFGKTPDDVKGKIELISPKQVGTLLRRESIAETGESKLVYTGTLISLERRVAAFKPDILILDPLVELHDIGENENTAMRAFMADLRVLAIRHNGTCQRL
jgi:RecA-family ATPase